MSRDPSEAPTVASPGLDALRARRPAPEERSIAGWPFLAVAEGDRRLVASMTVEGDLVQLSAADGLEGLRRALALIDPHADFSAADRRWLVQQFGWRLLEQHPTSAKEWLTDDGVNRVAVFIGDDSLRLTVGRREEGPLRLRGELALLELPRRGEVKVAHQDAFEAVAPPLFQGLVERFGVRAADALWRFRHFRREGRGVQANVKLERVDVGPFTWLVLEADGWRVEVTAVDEKAVELSRHRTTEEAWQRWERAPALISTLLRSVDRARVTEEHVFALFAQLELGDVLAEPPPVWEGDTLRFVVKHDDGISQDARELVVVALEKASVRFEALRRRR